MADPNSTFIDGLCAAGIAEAGDLTGAAFGMALEQALYRDVMDKGREAVRRAMEELDPDEDTVEEDGVVWTRVLNGPCTYETRFGPVRVERGLFRAKRNGPTRCFMEERFGIFDGRWTPDAARLCALLRADLTSRTTETFLKEQGGMSPSRTKLEQLPTRLNQTIEKHREELDAELRSDYEIPQEAVSAGVSLDGVMVTLVVNNRKFLAEKAKKAGRQVRGPIGRSEASVGSVSFYDAEGERLMTRRFARMPEEEKETLKDILRREVAHIRKVRPDLVLVAISDGAANNWSFLESLRPDYQIVDFYHTMEHIKGRLDAALGVNKPRNQRVYAQMRQTLLEVPDGHKLVFEALEALEKEAKTFKPRKKVGKGAQPTFYERHHDRMAFFEHGHMNLPIGSGVVEGTARYMVVDRLRRTGMRWKRPGGQGVLNLRQYAANEQFNLAWNLTMQFAAADQRKSANNTAHHRRKAAS